MKRDKEMVSRLVDWITERQRIYERRKAGKPKPWTTDTIMQTGRFCNVYREQDKVTRWIAENWRIPNEDDRDLWFAMLVARYINQPSTLEMLGYPVPWNSRRWLGTVDVLKSRGVGIFNAAYIIPPTAGSRSGGTTVGGPKHEALDRFFTHFWQERRRFRPAKGQYLSTYSEELCTVPGMGRFFAGQIIADIKYTTRLEDAPDWWTFAISGPGSRRGLNRVLVRDVKAAWKEDVWKEQLDDLRQVVNIMLKKYKGMEPLHGQDMQNCLCEFDKYERARTGQGRVKQKFDGI